MATSKWLAEAEAALRARFSSYGDSSDFSGNSLAERAPEPSHAPDSSATVSNVTTVPYKQKRPSSPLRPLSAGSFPVPCDNSDVSANSLLAAWRGGVARLHSDRAPLDFPPLRWLQIIDDAARFLEGGLAAEAAAAGWGTLDLFGADRVKPYARIDRMGLLVMLKGGTLAELHRDHAVIVTRTGARQTFRRRPVDPAQIVPAWDLRSPIRPPGPADAA